MSKNNIIEQLGDIENIFVSWYKYKTNKTYKNNQSEAERIIKEDLGIAADSFPLLEKLVNEYGLRDSYPELCEASGDNALDFIREVKHDLNKESINHYRGLLVQELMGGKDMAIINEFYAFSKDISRWADNLKKDEDVLYNLENRQNKTSAEAGHVKAEQNEGNGGYSWPEWLRVSEVEKFTGINRGIVSQAASSGKLQSNNKRDRARRINLIGLVEWLKKRQDNENLDETPESIKELLGRLPVNAKN